LINVNPTLLFVAIMKCVGIVPVRNYMRIGTKGECLRSPSVLRVNFRHNALVTVSFRLLYKQTVSAVCWLTLVDAGDYQSYQQSTEWSKMRHSGFYFCDNFCKCASILNTIFLNVRTRNLRRKKLDDRLRLPLHLYFVTALYL